MQEWYANACQDAVKIPFESLSPSVNSVDVAGASIGLNIGKSGRPAGRPSLGGTRLARLGHLFSRDAVKRHLEAFGNGLVGQLSPMHVEARPKMRIVQDPVEAPVCQS